MKIFNKIIKTNKGMTYVELIVVLSIFATMSSVVLFNYRDFQAKVEIKSLSNNVALKVVEAQKNAMSGKLAVGSIDNWKPSYGLYFNKNMPSSFIYFADLDNSSVFSSPAYNIDSPECDGVECLDKISFNQNYTVSELKVYCGEAKAVVGDVGGVAETIDPNSNPESSKDGVVDSLSVIFTRPDSGAVIQSSPDANCKIASATITLSSGGSMNSYVKVYSSGRVQIN
ncbi:MAG: type II secretion system protein [bacterium]